jgi:polyisoprenoid-binding protein YceI
MQSRRPSWALVALVLALPGVTLAAWQATQPNVTFTCTGPGGLRIEGKGTEMQVSDRADALVVTVPLAKISTGIDLRDGHMHGKYLESAKYPTAELVVPRAGLKFPADGATVNASAPGTMTLHGQSKPVNFHYKATRQGKTYAVQGEVHVDMRDYGIATPSYLGITVKPQVEVAVTFGLAQT